MELSADVLAPGTTVGHYMVERFIASGGFGEVYEVWDSGADRRAAMKVLHPGLRDRSEALVSFLREGQILDRLGHRNIIELYDAGLMPDGRAYVTMELLSGESLGDFIARHDKLDPERALTLLAPICRALAFAHDQGVVHRDVKASNVILQPSAGHQVVDMDVDDDGQRVVLLDFGLARILEDDVLSITGPMVSVGSPATLSPEQIVGDAITPCTDVYALGCLAFQMLTGQLPFSGSSAARMHYMHLHGDRPVASALANVGPAVDEVIARAMARAPEERFAGPHEFLAAFGRAMESSRARPRPRGDAGIEPAIGLLVDLRWSQHDDDDGLLDEVDTILELAERHLTDRGFAVGLESSNYVLFIRTIADDSLAERRAALEAATTLVDMIGDGGGAVHVNVVLHHDSVRSSDGEIRGGDLTDLARWMPRGRIVGVAGSSSALEGLGIELEPVGGDEHLSRPVASGVGSEPVSEVLGGADRRSRERLMHSEMMARIGRQTAGIVHDLRSPLSAVMGNLEYMTEQLDAGEVSVTELRAALADACLAAEQMANTISTVLRASKVKSYDGDRRVIPVHEVIESAVGLAASETRAKANVEVTHRGSGSIFGIPGRLIQALVNLLVNAAQAIAEAGPGTGPETGLEAGREMGLEMEMGSINVDTVTENGRVTIAIRDSGNGMSEEVQARIFEPFFTTKDLDQGTGLGLSLVKEIITEHGGTIALASIQGFGTCFVITLPAWHESSSQPGL